MSRISKKKYSFAQQHCLRAAGRLSQRLEMLRPGARVGVAVSGGMDSLTLLAVMHLRRSIVPFPYELMALHVNPGFDPQSHEPLARWLEREGIPAHLDCSDHGPRAHSPENRKASPCFYCAMLRRKRLFELCGRYNLTHLALGHNADDLAATFFMNMFQNGRVDGMSMKEPFFGGKLTVIRPLMLVEKKSIAKAARDWNLPVTANACPSAGATKRSMVLEDIKTIWRNNKRSRTKTINALLRWQFAKHAGGRSAL